MRSLLFILVLISFLPNLLGQELPPERVLKLPELVHYLKPSVINKLADNEGNVSVSRLAEYFRVKFSNSYFYNWEYNEKRFATYKSLYEKNEEHHLRALDHQGKFYAHTMWQLPFNYKDEKPVDAYALRHLARQHKMVDIALDYYTDKDPNKVAYFKEQLASLNLALAANQFETLESGNGVYEAFRSGYRILNWLQVHNLFLGAETYTDKDQLATIATLVQHASNLYVTNQHFNPGNHQTRGMSALALLAILFDDFKDAKLWKDRAMHLLEEHLDQEVNEDGFQFERSVHYHISDIENYFYVYQLAQINGVQVSSSFKNKLNTLFSTLVKIAYPDKSAPVFSDDTDTPWGESNAISETLTLGYLLFDDPHMGYFAKDIVASKLYWFLKNEQLDQLNSRKKTKPKYKSLSLAETGYYIMREGWDKDDLMLVISAGLDPDKPDHQHGDILGLQMYGNEQILLPNYQVRYSLNDLELFKNSYVKNVALPDHLLQGKHYRSNKGGSGFGKFGSLPQPKTLVFSTSDSLDVYIGEHSGFEEQGIKYSRQVFFIDQNFWIVKDNFRSSETHDYQQIWQGHYTLEEAPQLSRSSFRNGSGLDIYQFYPIDTITTTGKRGKEWSIPKVQARENYSFVTALVPFKTYEDRIDETNANPKIKNWDFTFIDNQTAEEKGLHLSKEDEHYFINVINITVRNVQLSLSEAADIYIKEMNDKLELQTLSDKPLRLSVKYINNKQISHVEPLDVGASITIDLIP